MTVTLVREWHAAALHTARERAEARAQAAQRHKQARQTHQARQWARAQGLPVADTGRLPTSVLAAWAADRTRLLVPDPMPEQVDHGTGQVQVTHAYRLLRLLLQNALREGLIDANPCQLPGAGTIKAKERVPASLPDLEKLAAAMPDRYAAAIHVAAWSGLRAGELFALARINVDLAAGTVRVQRSLLELPGQPITMKAPKTAASRRTVHLPPHVVDQLREHLERYVAKSDDALVFATESGAPLSRARRTRLFRQACTATGRDDLRWHDLRHTGATIAAQAGASIRELQHRLGHTTYSAAMLYQHADAARDRQLAERMTSLALPDASRLPVADRPEPISARHAFPGSAGMSEG
jgi:integrase